MLSFFYVARDLSKRHDVDICRSREAPLQVETEVQPARTDLPQNLYLLLRGWQNSISVQAGASNFWMPIVEHAIAPLVHIWADGLVEACEQGALEFSAARPYEGMGQEAQAQAVIEQTHGYAALAQDVVLMKGVMFRRKGEREAPRLSRLLRGYGVAL